MRFLLGIQRSRAGVYVLAVASALLFRALDVLPVDPLEAIAIAGLGVLSAGVVTHVLLRSPDLYRRLKLEPFWLAVDVTLVSWAVAASGGLSSPWYLWYLGSVAAAAFAAGWRGTLLVSLGNAAGYLGVLALRREIGFLDPPCLLAVARLVFLHGAALFFLRGVADLASRRQEVRQLRAEDARRLADLERLAAALDQRTSELSAANRKVREADRQKSRFLANVSHELRTPLNSILGFSQILATRFAADLPEKPRRFLGNIRTSGEHLLKVLDDVLDLSKIEAGRMTLVPETVDAAALVAETIAAAQGEAAPRGIALEARLPGGLPPLEADPLKVKQALLNLLANAIHFSPDGGTVTVAAEPLEAEASRLRVPAMRLSVRDEGIGIAPENQAVVFDEFRQAHRRSGGTGLGLALVKSLTELHGGSVGLRSEPGHGSTFFLELPRRFRAARERRSEDSSSGEVPVLAPPRVLLVDESGAEAMREALEKEGCLPLTAGPGPETLHLARMVHPAAIAVRLEGPASFTLLSGLRGEPELRDVPVVLWASGGGGRYLALTADDLVFGRFVPERGGEEGAAHLELTGDLDGLARAAALSRQAARSGAPLLRLFVPWREEDEAVSERLALLASSAGEPPAAAAALVGAVARRAAARATAA